MRKADCTPEQWAAKLARQRAYTAKNPPSAEQRAKKALYLRRLRSDPKKREEYNRRQRERMAEPEVREKVLAYKKRPEVVAHRKAVRVRKSGITPDLVAALMDVQDGRCAVCGVAFTFTPHADHCHDTGRPRGLLCSPCNTAEGLIKKTGLTPQGFADRLQRYLDNPPARIAELV